MSKNNSDIKFSTLTNEQKEALINCIDNNIIFADAIHSDPKIKEYGELLNSVGGIPSGYYTYQNNIYEVNTIIGYETRGSNCYYITKIDSVILQ